MDIYIGRVIKQKMIEKKLDTHFLADLMGMHVGSVNRLYGYKSVQTDVLLTVSTSLNYDFFSVYSQSLNLKVEETIVKQPEVIVVSNTEKLIEEKNIKIENLEKEIAYLKEINSLLRKK